MKKVSMSGSLRESVGKKDAKKNRREGKIPCVLYGGEKQVHFVTDEIKFEKIINSPDVFSIDIDIDGKIYNAILQDLQFHPVSDRVLHADFLELIPGKEFSIGIPVNLVGTSPGVIAGGQLIKKMHKVKLRGLADDMPVTIDVDISKLVIGSSIKIKDLEIEKLTFLDPPNSVIVRVKTSRTVAADAVDDEDDESDEEGGEEGGETPAAEE